MELYSQHQDNNHQLSQLQQKNPRTSFLAPYERFQNLIGLEIKINILRFFVVTFIYYNADTFLAKRQNSSEPWNSMIYFLAMMIEVIRFIGDISLRNFLKSEKSKLIQVQNALHSQEPAPVVLKAAPYEYYLDIFSLVRMFKFTHKNYSSAFSISKYMHFLCTFMTFGWMSLKWQYGAATPIQFATLWLFLMSIFITTFETDMYILETSMGKNVNKNTKNYERPLSSHEMQDIERNFKKWRNQNIIWQVTAMVFIICGLIVKRQLSFLFCTSLLVCFVNLYAFYLETIIKRQCQIAVKHLKRQQVNTYSVLNRSASGIRIPFRIAIIGQRVSTLMLWCAFARDSTIPVEQSVLIGVGVFILILAQKIKFNRGNSLKLMMIRQFQYCQQNLQTQSQKIECAICLKEIQNKQKVKILPCSKEHIFHEECLKDWNKYKTECPLCRYQLSDYM